MVDQSRMTGLQWEQQHHDMQNMAKMMTFVKIGMMKLKTGLTYIQENKILHLNCVNFFWSSKKWFGLVKVLPLEWLLLRVSAVFYYTNVKWPNSYKFLRPFDLKGTYSIGQLCPNVSITYRSFNAYVILWYLELSARQVFRGHHLFPKKSLTWVKINTN